MARRFSLLLVLLGLLMLASCQRAHKYAPIAKPAPVKTESKDEEPDRGLYLLSWTEPRGAPVDTPIRFIAEGDAEWSRLKGYWNALPFPGGMPTVHLGLGPMQAAAALVVAEHHTAVTIKVPRGLPDPTELFPKSNPPTLGKWRIGKLLFHEPQLDAKGGPYSCASCHKPEFGFAERNPVSAGGKYNTLSLVNVAYNRRQFWDGRVEMLEETLVRSMTDEQLVDPLRSDKALQQHNWGGFVRALVATEKYDAQFQVVFGVDHPTQDTVAQALATYLRTILAGDSLYDRVRKKNAGTLTAVEFLALLKDENVREALQEDSEKKRSADQLAGLLERGYRLFHGEARCVQCHSGPLFTDRDYHNVGYTGKDGDPDIGTESGRALHVPVGRKESRLIGAFRTPSLRNLAKTGPYFHNGEHFSLAEVVEFYHHKVVPSSHLAKELKNADEAPLWKLMPDDIEALTLFVRALEGTPVDPMVMGTAR